MLCIGFLSMFLAMDLGVKWKTHDTGVFRPLVIRETVVSCQGELFIIARSSRQVLKFGADGTKLTTFGKRGEGPGEFVLPTWFHKDRDRLYVEDTASKRVSVFSLEGEHLKSIRIPLQNIVMKKVKGGWVYADWDSAVDPETPVTVKFADESFGNPQQIMSWQRVPKKPPYPDEASGKLVIPANPAVEYGHMGVNSTGTTVYVIKQKSADVHIIDVAQKKVVKVVEADAKPLPFNNQWGDDFVAMVKDAFVVKGGLPLKFVPDYPDYFPLVRSLSVTSDNRVLVHRWTALPDNRRLIHIYDTEGEVAESSLSYEALERLVYLNDDWAYLTIFENEEGGVACVARNQANEFVKANPIDYDGLPGEIVANLED